MEIYHLINRGVDGRDIFLDDFDRFRFMQSLFLFNDSKDVLSTFRKRSDEINLEYVHKRKKLVKIYAFCLMRNHYHILVEELVEGGIVLFMKKLNKGYSNYFNVRFKRKGTLWMGRYKKVLIERNTHFLYIPYYIHLNPLDIVMPEWRKGEVKDVKKALKFLSEYKWSSYLDYNGIKNYPSILDINFLQNILGSHKSQAKEIKNIITSEYLSEGSLQIEL